MASQVESLKWVPGTSRRFLVDGFRFASPAVAAYFLTHAHSDHTTGLSSSWSAGPIYCSPITARLLRQDFNLRPDLLRILEPDQPATICGVEVTPIDANHCPGAVMFLFKVPNTLAGGGAPGSSQAAHQQQQQRGRPQKASSLACTSGAAAAAAAAAASSFTCILHTGDMRWHAGMAAHPALAGLRIDCLMLDTTYCQPKWTFPPQEDAVALMVQTMAREAAVEPATLFVVGSYHIGKERAYLGAAHQLGWRVHCTPAKRRLLRLLGLPPEWLALLTDDAEQAQIHVLSMGEQLHEQALADSIAGTRWQRVVAIKPTGWSFRQRGGLDVRVEGCVTLIGLPYSEHSSWAELRECVAALRPRRIIPTVNADAAGKSRALVDRFADLMDLSQDRSRLDAYLLPRCPPAAAPTESSDGIAGIGGGSGASGDSVHMWSAGRGGQLGAAPAAAKQPPGGSRSSSSLEGSSGGPTGGVCVTGGCDGPPAAGAASAAEGSSGAAGGTVQAAVQQDVLKPRPPPAPRLGGASVLGAAAAPAEAAVQGGAAAAGAAWQEAAAPASAAVPAGRGAGQEELDSIDVDSIDVAEQRRILQMIQSRSSSGAAGRGSGQAGGSGSRSGAAAGGCAAGGPARAGAASGSSKKRPPPGSSTGLQQRSLRRFFSPSQPPSR